VLRKMPEEKIYVAEADAERPGEGQLLAKLLEPDIVVWLSLEEAHGVNYDSLVLGLHDHPEARIDSIKKEIAHEFGYFLDNVKSFVVLNKDNRYIVQESSRAKAEVSFISRLDVAGFVPEKVSVTIKTKYGDFHIPKLVPKEAGLSVVAVYNVIQQLEEPFDFHFTNFVLPPGRSSVFKGIKDTTLIDSTYNATFDGVKTMLDLITRYPATGPKWLVLGDMIEQGKSEKYEHELLASLIRDVHPAKTILIGPRLAGSTYPKLVSMFGKENVVSFMMPKEALLFLEKELKGGETILFKGARFIEGIIEKLLADPKHASELCRREEVWVERRRRWGI
jgi:UDP-N-acetylmuramyl pentapeptide synthase